MSSLPISRGEGVNAENPLARAFASFTEAAGSLERTYGQLRAQVTHLSEELEVTNRDLGKSLEENRRIRERLRRIMESLPCGVLVLEAEDQVSMLNPEAARLLGNCDGGLLPSGLEETLRLARETGSEHELALPPDREAPANPSWVAIRHAWLEQEHSTSVFIVRDVSEIRKIEGERESFRRRQALAEMAGVLAHEIRNPLGSLELFAGLLAEADLADENQRWVEHVQAGLRTLSATVNNVLHLDNEPAAECAEMDFGELLDWAHDFLLPLAKQAGVQLQVMNGLRGVKRGADRHRLEQVLLNLALNSFRFTPAGGWVVISGEGVRAGIVEILVRDTGSGIAAKHLPRIFESGFSTRPGSSGLGLAVCHKIIEQHGGSIRAESCEGQGTTFRLQFPGNRANHETTVAC
jgi:signal transduction histidine kinase